MQDLLNTPFVQLIGLNVFNGNISQVKQELTANLLGEQFPSRGLKLMQAKISFPESGSQSHDEGGWSTWVKCQAGQVCIANIEPVNVREEPHGSLKYDGPAVEKEHEGGWSTWEATMKNNFVLFFKCTTEGVFLEPYGFGQAPHQILRYLSDTDLLQRYRVIKPCREKAIGKQGANSIAQAAQQSSVQSSSGASSSGAHDEPIKVQLQVPQLHQFQQLQVPQLCGDEVAQLLHQLQIQQLEIQTLRTHNLELEDAAK